jgi:hypothetical protein
LITNLQETEDEGQRLFGKNFLSVRYEDVLEHPFEELTRVWAFLGVKKVNKSLEKDIRVEMASNPDEEWQTQRNGDISSFLPKGQAGNWTRLFSARDKAIFKEVAGGMLVKWSYEKDNNW